MTIYKVLSDLIHMLTCTDTNLEESDSFNITSFKITAPRSEYGKICGARGKMIRGIKHLFEYAISRAIGEPLKVTLLEPHTGFMGAPTETEPSLYDPNKVQELCLDILSLMSEVQVEWDMDDTGRYIYTIDMEHEMIDEAFIEAFNVVLKGASKANGCSATFVFSKQEDGQDNRRED